MRPIKFRGKRIDTGEWVFGNLVNVRDGNTSRYYPCIVISYNHDSFDWIEVKPETVGQFTGYLDENKQEVYEDDIVRCIDPDGEEYVTTVRHDGGAFAIDVVSCDYDYSAIGWAIDVDVEEMRVIGNIYDNPELLEGFES